MPDHGNDNDIYYWLALERVPRVGPLSMARLIDAFGAPRRALESSAREIRAVTGLSKNLAKAISDFVIPDNDVRRDMDTLHALSARVMTRWDSDYPVNLKTIYDPPALLFVRGSLVAEDSRAVAVVGTRTPSQYGLRMTEDITRDLIRAGVTVVSGLARGIDTACHKAALKYRGRTIGVLGCGLGVVYPKENGPLMEEIAGSGAVISEFRPYVKPLATNFYRRNRIVSGLTKGVAVVEAGKASGSLITAGHAVDQNRDVFAVPGSVTNERSRGPHLLLKQGAGLVETGEDIVAALFGPTPVAVQPTLFDEARPAKPSSDRASLVVNALDPDPIHIDELCESLSMDVGPLSALLLELELDGLVRQHPGKMFSRSTK